MRCAVCGEFIIGQPVYADKFLVSKFCSEEHRDEWVVAQK